MPIFNSMNFIDIYIFLDCGFA